MTLFPLICPRFQYQRLVFTFPSLLSSLLIRGGDVSLSRYRAGSMLQPSHALEFSSPQCTSIDRWFCSLPT